MINSSLATALFPKSRRAVLGLLLTHPDEAFYLREIAQKTGLGTGHLHRELDRLSSAGIIRRFTRGRHVYFEADRSCPVYAELRGLITRTLGAAPLIREALLPLGDRIRFAFIFGSVARGEENSGSDIDLLVIGDVALADIVSAIRGLEQVLSRPVNPTVYPTTEFNARLAEGSHFVSKIAESEKLMLIGTEDELRALSGTSLDSSA
jgi:predicted nucleotidyltransferase